MRYSVEGSSEKWCVKEMNKRMYPANVVLFSLNTL
jgi:hypothetical protein